MGLRARLLLVVLLATIPALLLALYTDLAQRRFAAAKVANEALKAVQVVAASQNGLIETTRGHLAGLTKFPQARGNDSSSFEQFFATMCKVYPDYTDFGIIQTNGTLISSAFGLRGPTNLSLRLYFQRVLKNGGPAVGEYQPGDIPSKASLPIGYPLLDETGRVVRVVYAALNLAALNRGLAKSPLPEGAVADVFDSRGQVVARYPDPQAWIGKSYSNSILFATMARQSEGTAELPGLDDVPRLFAFTTVRGGADPGLFVSIGIPTSVAYSEAKHLLILNLTILCGVAILVLAAGWTYADRYVLHPINALLSSTRRVASGDLSARAGIANASAELQQLGQAFDVMAAGLERQRGEMDQAREEVSRLNLSLEARVGERTAQLSELNRQLEAFSYSVSHDLRAPLRHISAFIELLEKESGSSFTEEALHFLKQISEAIARMNALVENLLAFARMAREEIRRERVSTSELVLEVQRELQRDTDGREIRWNIAPLPEVTVSRAMFKQVWANLLDNAVKYTRGRQPAEISVGCRDQPDEVEFFVRDNGAGFDMKYSDKLFGVFQRLHLPDQFDGTGIGLAIVQRIIARHGGRVWAEAEVDRGAIFWFSLPKSSKHHP